MYRQTNVVDEQTSDWTSYVGQINDSYTKKSTMHRLDIVEFDLKSISQLMRSNCKMCACHWKTVFSVFTTFDFNE